MPITMRMTALVLSVTWLVASSCRGRDAFDGQSARSTVLTIATPADADMLIPPLVTTTQGKQVVDLLFDVLAAPVAPIETVGDASFRPQLAAGWQWASDSLSIAFQIDPRARWHDGRPVRANDVRFSFSVYTDPVVASPHAGNFTGIDSVTVRDSLTAVAWWHARHPEQFYQLAYNLAILPEHLLRSVPRDSLAQSAFASHPIGSGRYRFERWNRQHDLVIAADSANYRGVPSASRVVWIVAADPTAASLSVFSGQADILESVRGDAFTQARRTTNVRTVEYGSLDYGYMLFNFERTVSGNKRLFAERALRVALTEALDRSAVVANALDSLGAVAIGPVTRAAATADTSMRQIGFDTAAASRALNALGWTRRTTDGMRARGSNALRFNVLVPSSSATRQRIAVLLQEQYRRIGVDMQVVPLEPQLFGARLERGDFDAALNMWRADPSPAGIRQVWGTARGRDIGANFGRYANATFDAFVDSASTAFNAAQRRAWYRSAYRTLVDDAAAIWLYEPRNFAAVSSRVQPTGMRADAWWAALADWRVDNVVASTQPAR